MAHDAIVTVTISESFHLPVEIRLENRRLPGRAQNYCAVVRLLPDQGTGEDPDTPSPPPWFRDLTHEGQETVVPLPTKEVIDLLDMIQQARIPLMCEGEMGCDGVTYEVWFGEDFNSTKYRWWVKAPPGWEPLERLVQTLCWLAFRSGPYIPPKLKAYRVP